MDNSYLDSTRVYHGILYGKISLDNIRRLQELYPDETGQDIEVAKNIVLSKFGINKPPSDNIESDWAIHFLKGIYLYRQGDIELSEIELRKSLTLKDFLWSHLFLSWIFNYLDEQDEALTHFANALEISRSTPMLLSEIELLLDIGNYELAREKFGLISKPDDNGVLLSFWYSVKGQVESSENEYLLAIESYKASLALDESNVISLNGIFYILADAADVHSFGYYLDQYKNEAFKYNASYLAYKALYLAATNQLEQAKELYKQSVEITKNPWVFKELWSLQIETRELAEAKETATKFIKYYPSITDGYICMAATLALLGEREECTAAVAAYVQLFPSEEDFEALANEFLYWGLDLTAY